MCSDDRDASAHVRQLVTTLPDLRGFDGGSLANSVGVEAFAAVLLTINVRQRGKATLQLAGVEPPGPG